MSTLRSGLDELASEDLRYASDQELEESLIEIERAAGVLEAERARRVAEAGQRRAYRADGHLSPTSWLSNVLRVGPSRAARYVRWARCAGADALREGKAGLRRALDLGRLGPDRRSRVAPG